MPWMAIVGAALAGASVIQQSKEQEQAANDLETQTRFEQAAADQEAIIRADERQDRLKRILATQRAVFGASGVDPNTGSAAMLQSVSIGEATKEQLGDDIFARFGASARQNRLSSISRQRENITLTRNIGIGSTIAQSALRYKSV